MVAIHDERGELFLDTFGLSDSIAKFELTGYRCAAHTLELAIDDAMKQAPATRNLIGRAREVVKKLRNQIIMVLIRSSKLLAPVLDCKTRYFTIYI